MTTKPEQAQQSSAYPPQSSYPQQSAYPPPYPTSSGGPPPQPLHQAQQPVIVVQQPATYVVQTAAFGPTPVATTCPSCQQYVTTNTCHENGSLTWIICVVLAFLGCWLGCCLIPFCVNECKDVAHSCPSCQRRIGVYRRMS